MRYAVAVLVVLALLPACGDGGGSMGRPTSPPSATVTRTATAPPTATPVPATSTATAPPSSTPTALPLPTVPTLEPLAIHADADSIRDAQGRYVILRGANYSGLEFGNFIGHANGPEVSDFVQMASWGFNVIRLPIAWSYLEPQPNQLDDTYLRQQVDPILEFAAANGIVTVLEMHQFFWSPCFTNGNGAPAWACEGHGYPDSFNGAARAGCEFLTGATAPDGRALQDHFVDVWRMIARRYAGDRRVAGFDFLNEPSPVACGSDPLQVTGLLYDLYRRIRAAVQAEGATQTFFLEPTLLRNLGTPIDTQPFGPDVVYAPHLYTQTAGSADLKYNGDASTITADYELATSEAAGFGGPLFVGEFGGNTNVDGGFRDATAAFLRDSLCEQDRRLIGGAVWAYFPSDNTFSVVDADGNEKGDLVAILARPFARRIAGEPTEMHFDLQSKEFVFSWRVDAARAGAVSELFLPYRYYPNEFAVELPTGIALRFISASQTVLVVASEAGDYTLRFRP